MRRVLVTGGSGQVGGALSALRTDDLLFVSPPRAELDLASEESIRCYLQRQKLDGIINCAAYTAVDKAESEKELAFQINATAPGLLAQYSAQAQIPLLHVSTDYVFSGELDRPYVEDDVIAPINVYGASKAAGEAIIRSTTNHHIILRTSWVISAAGSNFLKTMLRLAADRDELRVVADQMGRPTSALDIAQILSLLVTKALDAQASFGTFHFANQGDTTWAAFAQPIFDCSRQRQGPSARIVPITTADYPTPAKRPRNSRLSTNKIETVYGITPRPWAEAVSEIVSTLIPQGAA